ncbi:glycosyl hydrolase family 28-related protein [Streptomyces sp. NPDC007901]|uniref:glycosyl hydrolase family 28-related protein n=1 Tax=Streptomyces sp. NPDC007901 TaxID=3364785 RepID=UPI0036F1410E
MASIAELKRLVTAPQGGTAAVAGYAKAGDNGGGDFTFIGVPATSRVTKATVVTIDITAMSVSSDHVATFTTAQPHNFVSGQSVFLSDVGTATGAWIITLDPSAPTTRFLVQGAPATAAIDAHTHPRASCVQLTVPDHGLPPGAQRIAVSGVLPEGTVKAAPINQIWDKSAVYDSNTLTLPVPTNGGTYKPGLRAVVGDEALRVTATDEAGTTGGLWQRTVTQPFNVAWWGATGDSSNDESAAINAAINAAKRFRDYSEKANTGTILHFGPGVYRCASKILIDGSVSLHGASGIGDQASTILFFAKDMGDGDALVDIQQIATDGSGTSAQFLRIYNLAVVQDDTAPLDETVRTVGIRVRSHGVILEDIFVHSIQGCGILIEGDPGRYNADNWCLKGSIRITNCRESGVVTQGGDANAGAQSGTLSVSGCGEWGVHEHSFLGNRWDAIHAEGNGYAINSDGLWTGQGNLLDPKFTWSQGAHISPGQLMLPTAKKRTGFIYRATDIGASPHQTASSPDSHEPNWPTKLGLAVPDGDITWTCWAHEGGALWHEGTENCSTYGYIYAEQGQNAPHFDNGTASVESVTDRMTAASEVATATVHTIPVPFQVWTRRSEAWDPGHQSSGSVRNPVIVGVGDQRESTVAWLKRADSNDDWGYPPAENPGKTAPNVPDHWTHDVGILWDRWDGVTGREHPNLHFPLDLEPPTHRWRVEWWARRTAVYPFHSYSQVGGQTLPQPAAICFPSLWLGNKTGCERRLGAVPARTDAPYLPDLSDVDVSGGNAFEQGDVLFNAPKDGQLNWPAAWRAKGRNAIKTKYFNPPGWFPQIYLPAGYVFRVPDGHPSGAGGSMWRARNSGYTTATTPPPTPQTEPAWVDRPGTQVSDGDIIWD